jgi:hypothetical protein
LQKAPQTRVFLEALTKVNISHSKNDFGTLSKIFVVSQKSFKSERLNVHFLGFQNDPNLFFAARAAHICAFCVILCEFCASSPKNA